jgi:hypothetical protein
MEPTTEPTIVTGVTTVPPTTPTVVTLPTTAPVITSTPYPTQTIAPPATTGAIYAQSSPAGAVIYLNGIVQGYSPYTIPDLYPGTYSMKASLNGYTPNTQLVNVYPGQTATYYPMLLPSPSAPRSTGTVFVFSNPDEALIYADGIYKGKAEMSITLYTGYHTFLLTLPGYDDFTETVYVNENKNYDLIVPMTPGTYGTVSVTSVPGAGVFIDSNQQGEIPPAGVLTLNNVPKGDHIFKVTAPGYKDWINTVNIPPNTVTSITATLTPVGPNPTPVPSTRVLYL